MITIRNPSDIVSDVEVERVHGNANFGSMTKRNVVNDGVLKYAFGYDCGHTQRCILAEHGLTSWKFTYAAGTLTAKGNSYLKSLGPMVLEAMKGVL